MGKKEIIDKMVEFWNEQASNAENYPSVNFYYKDGRKLGFYIQPRTYLDMPVAAYAVAYNAMWDSMETPSIIPMMPKKKIENQLNDILSNFEKNGVKLEDIESFDYTI